MMIAIGIGVDETTRIKKIRWPPFLWGTKNAQRYFYAPKKVSNHFIFCKRKKSAQTKDIIVEIIREKEKKGGKTAIVAVAAER